MWLHSRFYAADGFDRCNAVVFETATDVYQCELLPDHAGVHYWGGKQ